MSARLKARAWLHERRRLITLLDTDVAEPPARRSSLPPGKPARRPRLRRRVGLTVLSLGNTEAPPSPWSRDPEITHTEIRLRRLPPAWDGLKVVHLTDIHHSLFTPLEEVERAVALANRLRPDLVALTGDYVTSSPVYIRPVARALGKLRARRGVFAVLGNHDFQVDAEAITRALASERIRVLRNASQPLRASGATLWLLGVDDLWSDADDLPAALGSVPAREAKILLCHNPRGIRQAARQGVDLVLSGHTHGGQVRVPGFESLYRSKLGERFVAGWNRLQSTQIYVSRGIGKVLVPLRLGCPAEIACLVLRRTAG